MSQALEERKWSEKFLAFGRNKEKKKKKETYISGKSNRTKFKATSQRSSADLDMRVKRTSNWMNS